MALETLRGVAELGGFKVVVMDELRERFPEHFTETGAMDNEWFEETIRPNSFVYIRHDKNSLSFTLQNGPVKEVGVNGCQVDTIIAAAYKMLQGLNHNFPSIYNAWALTHLQMSMAVLKQRTADRQARGVEGKNEL